MSEKELLIKLYDHIILVYELNHVAKQKAEYVQVQDYEKASELRTYEKSLMAKMPTIEELKALRGTLK